VPNEIVLNLLGPGQGIAITSTVAQDNLGLSLSSAGDVNGDGITDLLLGTSVGVAGSVHAAKSYVIYGRAGTDRGAISLDTLTAADGFVIQGRANQNSADMNVSAAGDVNGDGLGDLILGAQYGNVGASGGGEAYVIYGRAGASRGTVSLPDLAARDGFVLHAAAPGDMVGRSVAGAGDVNGDGLDDVLIGASAADGGSNAAGAAYVIYGQLGAARPALVLSNLGVASGFALQGAAAADLLGTSVAMAGDVNGDGIADMIFGAPGNDQDGLGAGRAYLVYGKVGAARGPLDLAALSLADGFIIQGDDDDDLTGICVAAAGDVNGDGHADIIVGASGAGPTGRAYLIYGQAGAARGPIDLSNLAASDGFIIIGAQLGGQLGTSVSSAGDLNGDGLADIVIGAPNGLSQGGSGLGRAYVIFGQHGTTRGTLDLQGFSAAEGLMITAALGFDDTGGAVAGAGDFNGDGLSDVLIGAPLNDTNGSDAGAAYVIFGTRPSAAVHLTGTSAAQSLFGSAQNDTLFGHDGNDTLDGGAGADILDGGLGFDLLRYAMSQSAVQVDLSANSAAGGDAAGDTVAGFEALAGSAFGDWLAGDASGNWIGGLAGNDTITGGAGADTLAGGAGRDILTGGLDGDHFTFAAMSQMTTRVQTTDVITDFRRGQDKIDLSAIDASTRWDGNNTFTFDKTRAFGTKPEGDIYYKKFNLAGTRNDYTLVYIDTDADRAAEGMIKVMGLHNLTAGDFIL
jgi:Ca2+-binding RTX toxin-like protein